MRYPICIASKGRAGQSRTIETLISHGREMNVFVEPQDEKAYREAYPCIGELIHLHVLPLDNQGISYVRQHILERMRSVFYDWFWMLDDDITATFKVGSRKCIKIPMPEVLRDAEDLITEKQNVAIGALEYQQYAWSAAKPVRMNSYCDVAVLISVNKTKNVNYRPDCKEDRDFVLQILSLGYDAMRTSWLAFSVPKNGSNKGGLHDAYKSGLESHWSARMVKLWPGICTLNIKPDGRPDVKVHWRHFSKKN